MNFQFDKKYFNIVFLSQNVSILKLEIILNSVGLSINLGIIVYKMEIFDQ